MKQYKVSVLRIGAVLVWAEDAWEAKEKVQRPLRLILREYSYIFLYFHS